MRTTAAGPRSNRRSCITPCGNALPLVVGESTEISVPSTVPGDELFELRGPEQFVQRIVPKSLPSGLVFPVTSPDRPGVYLLGSGEQVLRSVAVNTDPVESDLARADEQQRTAFFSALGIVSPTVLEAHTDVRQAITDVRFGVELWKYMIALALLCALAEMLVARDVRRSAIEME